MTEQLRDQTRPRTSHTEDGLTRRARVLATVQRSAPKTVVTVKDEDRRGKFDPVLFAAFRAAAPGPRKRAMLNQLIYENEPLCKILTDQLCGRGDASRKRGFKAMSGCAGFRDLEWDDAYQAGLLALQKGLEQFDPSKGKWAPYVKMKLRHELQRLVFYGGSLIRVPRGNGQEQMDVALIGEEETLDVMSGGYEDMAPAPAEGITPEMIAEWERTGEWPESLEELRESLREKADEQDGDGEQAPRESGTFLIAPPPRVYLSGIEAFLSNRVALKPSERVETWTAYNAYRLECRKFGFREVVRPMFVRWLEASGIREVFVRLRNRPSVRALAGIRLV